VSLYEKFPAKVGGKYFQRNYKPAGMLLNVTAMIYSKFKLKLTFTYLLTPWCRLLLEKLVKKFPAFHGTRKFITALTSVRHLSLSWASPIQLEIKIALL